jgi:hypothetical protein
MKPETFKLSDISTEIKPNFILCSIVTKDGSYIKEKYIGYKLGEAKNKFSQMLKTL